MYMADSTLFQKILNGEIPGNFIYRGDGWGAFLDVFPRGEGHTLVVLENPSQRLADLSNSDIECLFSGVKQTQTILSSYLELKISQSQSTTALSQAKKFRTCTCMSSPGYKETAALLYLQCFRMQNHQIP